MGVNLIAIVVRTLGTAPKCLEKKTGGIGNQRNRDYPDHSSVKIHENTQKSLGGLRRLAVIETSANKPPANASVKNLQRVKALLRSARKLRRLLETLADFLSLKVEWKTIS